MVAPLGDEAPAGRVRVERVRLGEVRRRRERVAAEAGVAARPADELGADAERGQHRLEEGALAKVGGDRLGEAGDGRVGGEQPPQQRRAAAVRAAEQEEAVRGEERLRAGLVERQGFQRLRQEEERGVAAEDRVEDRKVDEGEEREDEEPGAALRRPAREDDGLHRADRSRRRQLRVKSAKGK